MIQRGERTSLLLEAGESVGILREEVGQYLDRDRTLELRVVRAIDLAHSARAEPGLDPKRAQLAARRQTFYGTEGCEYGRLAKRSGVVVCPEQRLDGSPQCGILTAGRSRYACRDGPSRVAAAENTRLMSGHLPGSMRGPCVNASYLPRDQRSVVGPCHGVGGPLGWGRGLPTRTNTSARMAGPSASMSLSVVTSAAAQRHVRSV